MKQVILTLGILFSAAIGFAPLSVGAFTFEKDLLITDRDFEYVDYLSTSGIQRFLQEKGSVLQNISASDTDGKNRSVAEIINRVATRHSINPMVLLVMAQKESSAITSSSSSYAIDNWILGYGRCDSCSEADAAPYRGMANQFTWAARGLRGYVDDINSRGHTVSGWGPGIAKTTMDGISVTPSNKATAALYTYNPCVGAYGGGYPNFGCNSAFQKLWQDWNANTVKYPDGTLLQAGGMIYLIHNGQKRAFTSMGALVANYDTRKIITVPVVAVEQYPTGQKILLPDFSLVRNPAGTVYLITGLKKRGIASQEAFRRLGFNPEEILDIGWGVANSYGEGSPITVKTTFAPGTLVQDDGNGAVYYVGAGGRKRAIFDRAILDNNFNQSAIVGASPADIQAIPEGRPMVLADGTLIKGSKAVFVISKGKRRAFDSGTTFEQLGYTWDTVVEVPKSVLKLHEKGKPVTLKKVKASSKSSKKKNK
ncbi:MAG: hypothetical protein COW24_01485 [Candidatus Kerfeldbacteria bacterium CG15_BIG_FIL_POST_REV_8_21_14_020_45_12]|uniref:Hemagglutinin-related protein n=1 Tax=Candidatus Kerfeldbacteria bacterium CG15_BIG_FIL_POST_REV_8_21_14_020_45_12 TaxID=2014247 RepID=A0A2M7H4N6_9BACT|nr:MAG: hypothetical protein COW24_01485 [Candidatus Kerfeldbacteria bacterium CG15_BIG_FIL_POST_REV_8_21_14_020_45_12]PJA92949.1 MAG: hypothetical protein CO132_05340 [Candidatus Kerfeldbacteria bacterium CG_4_9_14_3_um_filter_45_8]